MNWQCQPKRVEENSRRPKFLSHQRSGIKGMIIWLFLHSISIYCSIHATYFYLTSLHFLTSSSTSFPRSKGLSIAPKVGTVFSIYKYRTRPKLAILHVKACEQQIQKRQQLLFSYMSELHFTFLHLISPDK